MQLDPLSYERPRQEVPKDCRQVKFHMLEGTRERAKTIPEYKNLGDNYKRTTEQVLPTRLYIIISGGERREHHYFSNLKSIIPVGCAIPLYFVCPAGRKSSKNSSSHPGTSPNDLYDYWTSIYNDSINTLSLLGRSFRLEKDDRVYFVSDVDEYYQDLQSMLNDRLLPNIQWVISNPCIEVWLYYSFIGQPSEKDLCLLNKKSPRGRSKCLKRICSRYKGGTDPRKAPALIEAAIANANAFGHKTDENGIPVLFCSDMLHFAEEFVQYISTFEA